jgi:hypothetical protein
MLFPVEISEISSDMLDPSSISIVTDTTNNNLSRPDPINCDPKSKFFRILSFCFILSNNNLI